MSTTAIQDPVISRMHLEDDLVRRYRLYIAKLPQSALTKASKLPDRDALAELAKAAKEKAKSIETRNQEAVARMKAKALTRVQERCELLDSREVCEILGISKQALSQKAQAGQLAVYTNQSNRRKYYPAFQFRDNKVRPVIVKLISDLGVEPADAASMNKFVQHLITNMDYSGPGGPENVVPRFTLLDDAAAYAIIKRDWVYAYEHGQ